MPHERCKGAEKALRLLCLEGLVTPRPHALKTLPIAVKTPGLGLHLGERARQGRRRREEGAHDPVPLLAIAMEQRERRLGVLRREAADALPDLIQVAADRDAAAVRERVSPGVLRI